MRTPIVATTASFLLLSGFGCGSNDSSVQAADEFETVGAETGELHPEAYVGLTINELSATTPEWVEIYNGSEADIDISGFHLTDDLSMPTRAQIADGTIVPAGGFLQVEFSADPAEFPGFSLGPGERVALLNAEGSILIADIDFDVGDSPRGGSYGRIPDGVGTFKALAAPTPGAANQDNAGGSVCSDGIVEGDEECDDGDDRGGDGCDSLCRLEPGWTCAPHETKPKQVCITECGDSVIAGDENCDDGNRRDGDGCSIACQLEPTSQSESVVINEIVAKSPNADGIDWIEFYNAGAGEIDLEGWAYGDKDFFTEGHLVTFPAGTVLPANDYLVVERGALEDNGFGFNLGPDDRVYLLGPDGGLADLANWEDGDAPAGKSFGRSPNGAGPFVTLDTPTPGAENGA